MPNSHDRSIGRPRGSGPRPRIDLGRACSAAVLNLSGTGAGFLYLGRWRLALGYLGCLALWFVLAWGSQAWIVTLATLVVASAIVAGIVGALDGGPRRRSAWVPGVVGAVLLAVVGTSVLVYRNNAEDQVAALDAAHHSGDCRTAQEHLDRLAGAYRWAYGGSPGSLRAERDACTALVTAREAADADEPLKAVEAYETYLASPQARYEGAGHEAATVRFESADAFSDRDLRAAYRNYVTAARYSEGKPGGEDDTEQARKRIKDLFESHTRKADGRGPCTVLDRLDYFAGVEDTVGSTAAERAQDRLPGALLACARARNADEEFSTAAELASRVVDEFPDSTQAAPARVIARVADIKATIQEARDSGAGYLPEPWTGGISGSGPVTVYIENGAGEDIEILWTGPSTGREEIAGGSDGCEHEDLPGVTLSFPPGDYEVVAKASSGVDPFYGDWGLDDGAWYESCFYIETTSGYGGPGAYIPPLTLPELPELIEPAEPIDP